MEGGEKQTSSNNMQIIENFSDGAKTKNESAPTTYIGWEEISRSENKLFRRFH